MDLKGRDLKVKKEKNQKVSVRNISTSIKGEQKRRKRKHN